MADPELCIIGRTSSHFTRVTRIFAEELQVPCSFTSVPDLLSTDPSDYAGNPALRLPILEGTAGPWFGAIGICRELSRRSSREVAIVLPERPHPALLSQSPEPTLSAIAPDVPPLINHLRGTPLP